MTRREMVVEYFMPTLSIEGMVETIPLLLRDRTPNLGKLPGFLMRLGPQVGLSALFAIRQYLHMKLYRWIGSGVL
jgi:hypothetical protein